MNKQIAFWRAYYELYAHKKVPFLDLLVEVLIPDNMPERR